MERDLRSKSTAVELLQKLKHKQQEHISLQRNLLHSMEKPKHDSSLSRNSEFSHVHVRRTRRREHHISAPSKVSSDVPAKVVTRGPVSQRRTSLYQSTIIA